MDSFTQKLLERTRARRELLQQKMAEQGLGEAGGPSPGKRVRDPLADAANSSGRSPGIADLEGSPPKKRYSGGGNTENVHPQDPPLKVQPMAEKAETTHDAGGLTRDLATGSVKTRMQKLANQRRYWDGDAPDDGASISSPVSFNHVRDTLAAQPNDQPDASGQPSRSLTRSRLANLAATINTWEDDLSRSSAPTSDGGVTSAANKPKPAAVTAVNVNLAKPPVAAARTTFVKTPDKGPVKTGMTKSASGNVALASVKAAATPERPYSSLDRCKPAAAAAGPAVTLSAARQESQPQKSQGTTPLQARPPVSKTFTPTTPAQSASTSSTPANGSGVKTFRERFEERCQQQKAAGLTPTSSVAQSVSPKPAGGHAAGGRTITLGFEVFGRIRRQHQVLPDRGRDVNASTLSALQDRYRHGQGETIAASHADKLKQEREQELAMVRNRFQKGSVWANEKKGSVSDAPTEKGSSVVAGGSAAKPSVIPAPQGNGQKSTVTVQRSNALASPATPVQKTPAAATSEEAEPGRRVRFVSETEKLGSESTESFDLDSNGSQPGDDVSDSEDEENNSGVIDELFDDMMDDMAEGNRSKGTVATTEEVTALVKEAADDRKNNRESEDELEVSSLSLLAESISMVQSPEQKPLTSSPVPLSSVKSPSAPNSPEMPSPGQKSARTRLRRSGSLDSVVPTDEPRLLYSIDAYRSQRVSLHRRSPMKQAALRRADVRAEARPKLTADALSLRERLHLLTSEMNSQQSIMQQARMALNCCVDEEHGKGSLEEAEAERLLLVSTEKHQAFLSELNRLKANASARSGGRGAGGGAGTTPGEQTAACRGSVSISDIRLPLKPEFVCVLASRPDQGSYYFVVLIRQGAENIVPTPLVAAHLPPNGDTLTFPTTFTVQDVGSDFDIFLEVYCLTQKKDTGAPDKRKSKGLTPKKLLSSITKSGSNLHSPSIVISGGTRNSAFVLAGSHRLCLSSVGQAKFPLEKVQRMSPLEGNVYLKFQCRVDSSVEERGFLTMFEEVSGFGAWHRRWCVLSGNCLSYWTYPDDEKKKDPMGRLNLATCVSRRVEPVNREFCARPHTLELVTVRSQHANDRETLTTRMRNRQCVTKNWLSADSRDERNLWMEKFNQVLINLRTWQPEACAGASTR